jgi:hypothetical protein
MMAFVQPEHLDWVKSTHDPITGMTTIAVFHDGNYVTFNYPTRLAQRNGGALMRMIYRHKSELMTAAKVAEALSQ